MAKRSGRLRRWGDGNGNVMVGGLVTMMVGKRCEMVLCSQVRGKFDWEKMQIILDSRGPHTHHITRMLLGSAFGLVTASNAINLLRERQAAVMLNDEHTIIG